MECERGPQLYSTEEEGDHVITSNNVILQVHVWVLCDKQNRILFGNILLDG